MLHINLETCSSTQLHLKEQIQNDQGLLHQDVIVSTKVQTAGVGRGKNTWQHFEGAISMSCLLPAQNPLTTAPLKIGYFVSQFFEQKFNEEVLLKWPNDLMNSDNEKVGGIICQLIENRIIVGIGINIHQSSEFSKMKFKCNGLNLDPKKINTSDLSQQLYKYLLDNISEDFSVEKWNKKCSHFKKQVEIKDEFVSEFGLFESVSDIGEAILSNNGTIKKVLTGSLFII